MRKLLVGLTAFLLLTGSLLAQKTITGTVIDDKGTPLPNVSIVVRGTNSGTVTKSDGSYSLTLPANARQLVFSFLGYTSQTVNIGSGSNYSVTLVSSGSTEIDEVVVTGIKNIKKSEYAGAANKITAKEIENRPVGSFDQLLQGRAPGLLALTGSGQPGNNTAIIIRGTNSISGGSAPLYVIDGIPVEQGVFQSINPNDFASVDILRDAAAAALYGSRGGAGVIVATTKRGQSGKMKVSYAGQFGTKSKPDFSFRPMNTAELLKAQHDYGQVLGSNLLTNPVNTNTAIPGWFYSPDNPRYATLTAAEKTRADFILDSTSKINTNWLDEIFRPGSFSNHQISLSGGTGKTRIYSSVALYNEEGTTLRTDMKRVTVRNNLDYADDKLTVSVSTLLGYTKRSFQQATAGNSLGNPFLIAAVQVPYALAYKPNGEYATGNTANTLFTAANTLDQTKYDRNYNDQMKVTLGFVVAYKISRDFTAAINASIDFRETQGTNYGSRVAFVRATSSSITGQAGFQFESLSRFATTNVRPTLTYRKLFGNRHDIEVTAVGEYVQENTKGFQMQGYGIDPRTPNTPAAITYGNSVNQLYPILGGIGATTTFGGDAKERTGIASGLGMLRYTFDGKYTLTGSFRADGSSKLPPDTRWQNFYSVGAIWEASREDFMRNIRAIDVLRLRASYGGAGNHNNFPSSYIWQARYGGGNYSGIPTQVSTYPGNPGAIWEGTWITNIGIDFELFKKRVYGDLNVYDKTTKDLFVNKRLAPSTGGGGIDLNAGELQNRGFEWNINAEVLKTKDLVWTLFATGGYNKNKLTGLGGEEPYESGTSFLKIGLPLGSHYEVKWAGVDAATGQPLYYDIDGKITTVYNSSNAVTDFGTWEAPWKGGFGTTVRYKGFDLNVLFSWQQGANKVDNMEYFMENPVGFLNGGYNQSSDLNFWTKPGDIATTPSPVYGTNFSSKIIHDASFVRLRDITLSYTLPQPMLQKTRFISDARFFVQATNLYMWTKWRGMDPEAGAVNINLSEFPNPRGFTLGLNVTL